LSFVIPAVILCVNEFSGKNLKVRHPDRYNWDPKWLLSHLIDIYLHLDSPTLAAALANDQRSFSLDTFKVMADLLELFSFGKNIKIFQAYNVSELIYMVMHIYLRINLQKLYRKDFFPLYNIFRHPTLNS
jgi:hypothetical protein